MGNGEVEQRRNEVGVCQAGQLMCGVDRGEGKARREVKCCCWALYGAQRTMYGVAQSGEYWGRNDRLEVISP